MPTATWTSAMTGEVLTFTIYEPATEWNPVAGLYMFCKPGASRWDVLYVGQTTDFRQRFSSHEHWRDAVARGCTSVHALVMHSATDRDRFENMLIKQLNPSLNSQLKPRNVTGLLQGAGMARLGLLGGAMPKPPTGVGIAGLGGLRAAFRHE
jgi:hypothetical protein